MVKISVWNKFFYSYQQIIIFFPGARSNTQNYTFVLCDLNFDFKYTIGMAADWFHSSISTKFLLSLLIILLPCLGHEKIVIDSGIKEVEGVINRMIPIDINTNNRFIHSAATVVPDDTKYIVVHPATVYPTPVSAQNSLALPTNSPSLLQQLRSYQSAHYKDILVFDQLIFLHLLPNKIVIVSQKIFSDGKIFAVENTYQLNGLTSKNQTKMYKIKNGKQNEVLLVVINSNVMYRLGVKQSQKYTLAESVEITHLEFVSDNLFVASVKSKGIQFFKIVPGAIKVIKEYSCADLKLSSQNKGEKSLKQPEDILKAGQADSKGDKDSKIECQISDISLNVSSFVIYILDENSGLYYSELSIPNTSELTYQLSSPQLITEMKDCQALDIVSSQHFVVLCQVSMPNSYIQQILQFPDPQISNKTIYIKKDPLYHNCNLNDLIVTQDFFLVFDSYTIDVFWNSMKTGSFNELSAQHSKQHFNIPGLQIFAFKKNKNNEMFLYMVESNTLFKYRLTTFEGRIFVYSPIPIKKEIKIQVPGKCNEAQYPILTNNRQINQNFQCFYEAKLLLNIQEKLQQNTHEKKTMSIGAIVIMLAVLLILTWICLMKYRGLEKHARKILQKYRQRSRYDQNKFTI